MIEKLPVKQFSSISQVEEVIMMKTNEIIGHFNEMEAQECKSCISAKETGHAVCSKHFYDNQEQEEKPQEEIVVVRVINGKSHILLDSIIQP